MKTLQEIYKPLESLTDKGTLHSYIAPYEKLLAPYRDLPITLLEIGVQKGASLEMWSQYFAHPDTRIIGVDIEDQRVKSCADSRTHFTLGNIVSDAVLREIPALDIVIDDGSHVYWEQWLTFQKLWPRLKPTGLYVIEDVQSDSDCTALQRMHPFEVYDLRAEKKRYDDIMLVGRK